MYDSLWHDSIHLVDEKMVPRFIVRHFNVKQIILIFKNTLKPLTVIVCVIYIVSVLLNVVYGNQTYVVGAGAFAQIPPSTCHV